MYFCMPLSLLIYFAPLQLIFCMGTKELRNCISKAKTMTANEIHVIVSQVCIRLALCKNGIYASETTVIADVPKLIHIDW